MKIKNVFERHEIKYLLSEKEYKEIKSFIKAFTVPDEYGNTLIKNVYLDTEDFRLIRTSLEKPVFKEKIRLRSYGDVKKDSSVFLEMKRKYDKVVYKRRIALTYRDIKDFFASKKTLVSQIEKEIKHFAAFYGNLLPKVFISYEREAFYGKENRDLRITFDKNALWRDYDVSLEKGVYGTQILPDKTYLMEIKTSTAIPFNLARFLSEKKIYKVSFSKYGNAYTEIFNQKGGKAIAQ